MVDRAIKTPARLEPTAAIANVGAQVDKVCTIERLQLKFDLFAARILLPSSNDDSTGECSGSVRCGRGFRRVLTVIVQFTAICCRRRPIVGGVFHAATGGFVCCAASQSCRAPTCQPIRRVLKRIGDGRCRASTMRCRVAMLTPRSAAASRRLITRARSKFEADLGSLDMLSPQVIHTEAP